MPLREQARQGYKTMRGKTVDMHKLVKENEMTPAVGNMGVNARGDELGAGGRILKTREQTQKTLAPQRVSRTTVEVQDSSAKTNSKKETIQKSSRTKNDTN